MRERRERKDRKDRKALRSKTERTDKRHVTKKSMALMLQTLFEDNPDREYTTRQIFRTLRLNTHPAKMLALDTLEAMAWDDYLLRSDDAFRLNPKALTGRRERLPMTGNNETDMHLILEQYGLPYEYPAEAEAEANKISGDITAADLAEREDFRHVLTFTIDPHDAKDFDDALSIRLLDEGLYEVGVHIADVSHYVKEGSVIDQEAQRRATSVYLVDRTIPMLPEHLCNYVCSLRPNEEKLAYSAVFDIDTEGKVHRWRLVHTVIKSDRRFAYEEVQAVLDKPATEGEAATAADPTTAATPTANGPTYAAELHTLNAIARRLREKRFKGGAVKFDREELRFDIDDTGKPIRCYFKKATDANKLVEEFMLLANRYVAESIGKHGRGHDGKGKGKTLPYRIHDQPDPVKLETLRGFVSKFGYTLKTDGTKGEISNSLNALMDGCAGKREQKLIETVALRAMMKARYSVHNIGHYGLAFPYYTHFTSPIRRYPDTMVHRLLTHYQQGGRNANRERYEELCEHSSDMEIKASMAERDSIKYKMVEYLADKVGNVYDAHISGITNFGIYCEIDENHCEGMIQVGDLDDDYYEFDERNYCLRGRRHRRRYQLGDPLKIQVAATDIERRRIDFTLAQD